MSTLTLAASSARCSSAQRRPGDAGLHYTIDVGAEQQAAAIVEHAHAVTGLDTASLRVGTAQMQQRGIRIDIWTIAES